MKALVKTISNYEELEINKAVREEYISKMVQDPIIYSQENLPKRIKPKYNLIEYHFNPNHIHDILIKPDDSGARSIVMDFGHKQVLVDYDEVLATKLRMVFSGEM
jgi:hypothetical protein